MILYRAKCDWNLQFKFYLQVWRCDPERGASIRLWVDLACVTDWGRGFLGDGRSQLSWFIRTAVLVQSLTPAVIKRAPLQVARPWWEGEKRPLIGTVCVAKPGGDNWVSHNRGGRSTHSSGNHETFCPQNRRDTDRDRFTFRKPPSSERHPVPTNIVNWCQFWKWFFPEEKPQCGSNRNVNKPPLVNTPRSGLLFHPAFIPLRRHSD